MRTTADECRDDALDHLREAHRSLSKVLVERVPGYEEYTGDYRKSLTEAMHSVIDAINNVDRGY